MRLNKLWRLPTRYKAGVPPTSQVVFAFSVLTAESNASSSLAKALVHTNEAASGSKHELPRQSILGERVSSGPHIPGILTHWVLPVTASVEECPPEHEEGSLPPKKTRRTALSHVDPTPTPAPTIDRTVVDIVEHARGRSRLRSSGITEHGLSILQLVLFEGMPYRRAEEVSRLLQQHVLDLLQCSSCKESKYPDTIMVAKRPTSTGKHVIHFLQSSACGCAATCASGKVIPLTHSKISNLVCCLERLFPPDKTPSFRTMYAICIDTAPSPLPMWYVY